MSDQEQLNSLANDLAAEVGCDRSEITIHVCGVKCAHVWNGPEVEFMDGSGRSSTCSLCGAWAINVSMMEGA